MDEQYILKIITLGDANVGKTLISNRICGMHDDLTYMPTIGVEFNSTTMTYKDIFFKLQLWDTAGQECFAPIVRNYYKYIVGIFLVIDLTSQDSINSVEFWLNEYEKHRIKSCPTSIIAIGNKIDAKNRIKSYNEISAFFKKKRIPYIETSAKENKNVKKAVELLLDDILNKYDLDDHPGIHKRSEQHKRFGGSNNIVVKNREYCNDNHNHCCIIH